ncbi:MAG: radical SAM protein [Spirochaetota bacterium]
MAHARKKILLVYPGVFDSPFPELPMPLLYLSWALKKHGYIVDILDTRLTDFRSVTDLSPYLFAGISTMTGSMITHALAFASHARALAPALPLVWGGIHPTLLTEETLADTHVDIIVRGEGETTVCELADALSSGASLDTIAGVSFKRGGEMIHNPERPFLDMNTFDPELPYELFDLKRYTVSPFPVHTSRGCPHRCGFCYNMAFNHRRWRSKNAARTLDEIAYIVKRFNPAHICFTWEDEFFINVPRVREIAEGLLSRSITVSWESFCRFDSFTRVDDEALKVMERSGLRLLSFGGESGSERMLDTVICKDIKLDQVREATRRLSRTSIRQVISFMSGLPGETDEDMSKTFSFMDELATINGTIYFNGVFLYTPYPGTPLFERIVREYGYRPPTSFSAWGNFGIYRDVGATWYKPRYLKKYRAVSILTRFPFWKKEFALSDVKRGIVPERFARFPLNLVYFFYTRMAMFRWKHRWFRFAFEWSLLERMLARVRGFV